MSIRDTTIKTMGPVDGLDVYSNPMMELAFSHFEFNKSSRALILDLGCGYGNRTKAFVEDGRIRVIGIDINIEKLRQASPSASYVRATIEALPFQDSAFDAIFSFSVLQYVDWQSVISQCQRLLRPGGRAVFIENLAGNPFARTYRAIHRYLGWEYAPYQTPKRHIRNSELHYFRTVFDTTEFTAFHLLTPLALTIAALQEGFNGKLIQAQSTRFYQFLYRIDSGLLKKFPFLSRYCWHIVVCATNEDEN